MSSLGFVAKSLLIKSNFYLSIALIQVNPIEGSQTLLENIVEKLISHFKAQNKKHTIYI